MAKLNTSDRWIPLTPSWLGNRDQAAPFRVEVKRLPVAELDAMREAWATMRESRYATGEALDIFFAGKVRGPIGEVEVDGKPVNLRGMFEIAATNESLLFEGGLAVELVSMIEGVNVLEEGARGNSERRPGGSGSTGTAATPEAATP